MTDARKAAEQAEPRDAHSRLIEAVLLAVKESVTDDEALGVLEDPKAVAQRARMVGRLAEITRCAGEMSRALDAARSSPPESGASTLTETFDAQAEARVREIAREEAHLTIGKDWLAVRADYHDEIVRLEKLLGCADTDIDGINGRLEGLEKRVSALADRFCDVQAECGANDEAIDAEIARLRAQVERAREWEKLAREALVHAEKIACRVGGPIDIGVQVRDAAAFLATLDALDSLDRKATDG